LVGELQVLLDLLDRHLRHCDALGLARPEDDGEALCAAAMRK